jgi:hypothetical protein
MTDPNAQEDLPPPKPPRPSYPPTTTTQRQLEEDEMYARQLAEHYSATPQRRQTGWSPGRPSQRQNVSETEREYSFFDGMDSQSLTSIFHFLTVFMGR